MGLLVSTRRRIWALALALTSLSVGAGGWWLTRRPMTYAARQDPGEPVQERSMLEVLPDIEPGDLRELDGPDAGGADAAPAAPHRPEQATVRVPTPALAAAESYLLIGVDHTRGRWGRADSIVAAFFDDQTGHVGVVSIPRDLHVEVEGHGPARINAVLRIAVRAEADPLEAMRDAVEAVLDTPIDHVVVADLEAFERTVDGLGGLEVEVPCTIRDSFLDPRAEGGRRPLEVESGRQRMDGVTAAMYVRSRHGRSDWDRARRQQAVLVALRGRLRQVGPTGWLPVVGEALDAGVYTTMSRLELLGLARRVARVDAEHTHGVLIGTRQTHAERTPEGRYVLRPDFEAIDGQLAELFSAPSPGLRPERKRCPDPDVALRHRSG